MLWKEALWQGWGGQGDLSGWVTSWRRRASCSGVPTLRPQRTSRGDREPWGAQRDRGLPADVKPDLSWFLGKLPAAKLEVWLFLAQLPDPEAPVSAPVLVHRTPGGQPLTEWAPSLSQLHTAPSAQGSKLLKVAHPSGPSPHVTLLLCIPRPWKYPEVPGSTAACLKECLLFFS